MFEADTSLALGYRSRTQQVRRISEAWMGRNGYCLACDSDQLSPTIANTRTCDFVCNACSHPYELKSKLGKFSNRVLDGAYTAMLDTIRRGQTPTFLLLEYTPSWSVQRVRAIHHSLITETAVQARRPLAPSARRAGWIGCNIVLPAIALQGQIPLLVDGEATPKREARHAFARLENIAQIAATDRTWPAVILRFTERLGRRFSLHEMYLFEEELRVLFPNNRNIRPKIRQQLQVLRDAGLLVFLGGGNYERND